MASRNLSVSSDSLSSFGRSLHDIGAGAILGGNVFARVGMHPAMTRVSDPHERGLAVNDAWRRYGVVNVLSIGAVVAGWAGARLDEAGNSMLSERERPLAAAKDAAVAAVALTGIAAAIAGTSFGEMEHDGAVPLKDGDTVAAGASESERRTKRFLNVVGSLNLASAAALVGINAALAQANFRRPPARRFLRRRY